MENSQQLLVDRRRQLTDRVSGAPLVLSAYSQMQRSGDAAFGFEQEANFWYLTGIEAPDWWVVIDGTRGKTWLVNPDVDESHRIFDGSLSAELALKVSGVDGVISQDEATAMLHDLAKHHSMVYTIGDPPHAEYFNFVVNPAQKKMCKMLERIFGNVKDCQLELAELRAIKQPDEIKAIKKAIKLTVDAFQYVKATLPKLSHEYEVEAEFSYYFRRNGAKGHAYDPIVAGGGNACTLHYGENQAKLKHGSLLLLDIGARVDGYAADISRTYAIGEPTNRQTEVHHTVSEAHDQIIALLRPGLQVREYYEKVDQIMKNALVELHLFSEPADYRRYFPHAIGHGLGIDVHDSLGHPTEFLPGMVLTVEPGMYIPEESIGIRIEDDILITDIGHSNLSAALPKEL